MTEENPQEWRLQQQADEHPSADGSAADEYRLVRRAVKHSAIPPIPSDFAREMESLTRDHQEQAGFERWIVRIATACAGLSLLLAVPKGIALAYAAFNAQFSGMPWRLLAAGLIALLVVTSIDRWLLARREHEIGRSS